MELEGKKIETTLATGNTTTSLSTDVTRKLPDGFMLQLTAE